MTEQVKTEPQTEQILLVWRGYYLSASDKLIPVWVNVTQEEFESGQLPPDDPDHASFRIYEGKNAKKYMMRTPGSVYRVPQEPGTTKIYAMDARYVGMWPDEGQRLEWQATDRSARTTVEVWKKRDKEGAKDNFAALKPLKDRYKRLPSQDQRAALLAQVIAFITR
jgi:hypothetical protein